MDGARGHCYRKEIGSERNSDFSLVCDTNVCICVHVAVYIYDMKIEGEGLGG